MENSTTDDRIGAKQSVLYLHTHKYLFVCLFIHLLESFVCFDVLLCISSLVSFLLAFDVFCVVSVLQHGPLR